MVTEDQEDNSPNRIIIVDFGGQYTHLISRRLRDIGAYAELISTSGLKEDDLHCAGLILSGGPRSVGTEESISIPEFLNDAIFDTSIPVLGICYGHQLLGDLTGGKVVHGNNQEYGSTKVEIVTNSSLIDKTSESFVSWMSHGDHITEVADDFIVTMRTDNCPVAAMESSDKQIYGVQFHPEVTHTKNGFEMLKTFVHNICKIKTTKWDIKRYSEELIETMREEIGDQQVILGVSGGVDSTVTAQVLSEAIGKQLHAVLIDHGLLRKNEVDEVQRYFEQEMPEVNFYLVDATEKFMVNLSGISDPEKKREIIGHTFIEVFEAKALELANEFGAITYLGQGTIYSDRIESGAVGAESEKIKSHHNLTLPEKMELEIIEPIKDLYKDEVRQLGTILGIPANLLNRYPFPGPGLAVRIIGKVTEQRLDILREADHIFISELYKQGKQEKAWQAFAALLPVKATGVKGDNRAYGFIIALRSVHSKEGMTADVSKLSWEFLGQVSTRIINEIPEVTRVVYDISTKPPGTIEFE